MTLRPLPLRLLLHLHLGGRLDGGPQVVGDEGVVDWVEVREGHEVALLLL